MNTNEPARLILASTVIPQGDGSFLVKPGRPVHKFSLKEAAKRTGLSRGTIYRLYDSGLVKGERPSPRKIFVYADSLDEHMRKSQDHEFWDAARHKLFSAAI